MFRFKILLISLINVNITDGDIYIYLQKYIKLNEIIKFYIFDALRNFLVT